MNSFSRCPDCSLPLGRDRSKCRCGWVSVQVKQAEKNPDHVPCAADASCKFSGRMWLRTLLHSERVCVPHYYAALEADRSLARDPVVPPKIAA